MKHQEHIIAVISEKFNKLSETMNKKIIKISELKDKNFISNEDIIIAQRAMLETNVSFRQIIPYIAIKTKKDEYLTYTRTKSGNEKRLHKKISIGFGGHVDANDAIFDDNSVINIDKTIKLAATREIVEELGTDFYQKIKKSLNNIDIQKVIIDDKSDVEKVHIGLLITITIEGKKFDIESPESQIEINGFLKKEDIYKLDGDIEPWSKLTLE